MVSVWGERSSRASKLLPMNANSDSAAQGGLEVSDLNPAQREAVIHLGTPLLIVAGAGSGKTTVLARRIVHRIATKTADAQHVLAFTFTRQAGAELTRRLSGLGVGREITTGTFHAVAFGLLRQRWADTNRAPRNVITARSQILSKLAPNARAETLTQISLEIDWCRARMIDPTNYAAAASAAGRRPPMQAGEFEKVLRGYESEKQKRGVVDLDDLIHLVVQEMKTDRSFAEQIRWRFRHIHVDEAQDMNPLQYQFVRSLTDGRDGMRRRRQSILLV